MNGPKDHALLCRKCTCSLYPFRNIMPVFKKYLKYVLFKRKHVIIHLKQFGLYHFSKNVISNETGNCPLMCRIHCTFSGINVWISTAEHSFACKPCPPPLPPLYFDENAEFKDPVENGSKESLPKVRCKQSAVENK